MLIFKLTRVLRGAVQHEAVASKGAPKNTMTRGATGGLGGQFVFFRFLDHFVDHVPSVSTPSLAGVQRFYPRESGPPTILAEIACNW